MVDFDRIWISLAQVYWLCICCWGSGSGFILIHPYFNRQISTSSDLTLKNAFFFRSILEQQVQSCIITVSLNLHFWGICCKTWIQALCESPCTPYNTAARLFDPSNTIKVFSLYFLLDL